MNLPDPVVRYVLEAKPVHAALLQTLTQLAGFALMRLTSGRASVIDAGPVELARDAFDGCADRLHGLRVPAEATHHHSHLQGAAAALEQAIATALSKTTADAVFFDTLEEAERHLRAVSRTLPGFEMVDLTQSCCAAHSLPAGQSAALFCA